MIKSLRDTIEKAISGYYSTELTGWVLDWPGQVNNILTTRHCPQDEEVFAVVLF